jgi:hypothetical protein
MAEQRPLAEVVHRTPHRARLRVRLEEDGKTQFDRIAHELTQLQAVRVVRASPRTGSLLIEHEGDLEPILAQAKQWLEFEALEPHAPMRRLRRVVERIEEAPAHENVHLSSLAFFALLGASVYQAARGHFLPAGLPLVGFALRVMDWAADREPPLPRSGP